ncbi:uncharacterized protein [Lepeophtheirus salmonis]|nr:uncharacterized protein LOC121115758 [Lepeophtheirus salmonis]
MKQNYQDSQYDNKMSLEDDSVEAEYEGVNDNLVIKYRESKTGRDLTPIPLFIPDRIEGDQSIRTGSNPIIKALINVTNTIYALSGLGALSRGKPVTLDEDNQEDIEDEENDIQKTIDEEEKMNMRDPKLRQKGPISSKMSGNEENLSSSTDSFSIYLKETSTIWILAFAGTCIPLDTSSNKEINEKVLNKDQRDACERWCQTIDFPRKKKETQTDNILMKGSWSQTNVSEMLMNETSQPSE